MPALAVEPAKILKDLAALWVDLGKQDAAGVLRACTLTMIVAVDESNEPGAPDAAAVSESLALLMHEHPSRAIVLRVHASNDDLLDARVLAQCWMPFGRRQQICCEQIEITATRATFGDIPPVVRGLVTPDLPVVFYCPGTRLLDVQELEQLLPLMNKVIVDSTSGSDPGRVLDWLRDFSAPGVSAADLAWSRLTPWRGAVARIFDEPGRLARLRDGVASVEIAHTPAANSVQLRYLQAWFEEALGPRAAVKLAPVAQAAAYLGIASIGLRGPSLEAALTVMDNTCVEERVNGKVRRNSFAESSDAAALRQELGISGSDVLFQRVLRRAARSPSSH